MFSVQLRNEVGNKIENLTRKARIINQRERDKRKKTIDRMLNTVQKDISGSVDNCFK